MNENDVYDILSTSNEYEQIRNNLLSKQMVTNGSNQIFKEEKSFNLSEYKDKLDVFIGGENIAHVILNLLLLKPGTYPNSPKMGVNIAKYQFEFLDDITISELQNEINHQIETYIGSNIITYVDIEKLDDYEEMYKRSLIVKITVNLGMEVQVYRYMLSKTDKDKVKIDVVE